MGGQLSDVYIAFQIKRAIIMIKIPLFNLAQIIKQMYLFTLF
jgi:hypothetical protein